MAEAIGRLPAELARSVTWDKGPNCARGASESRLVVSRVQRAAADASMEAKICHAMRLFGHQ